MRKDTRSATVTVSNPPRGLRRKPDSPAGQSVMTVPTCGTPAHRLRPAGASDSGSQRGESSNYDPKLASEQAIGAANVLADIDGGDEPIPLTALPAHPAVPRKQGRRPHISACFRWASRGLRGHRLETARVFGVISTTASAIHRFNARLNGIESNTNVRTPSRRAKELARAERELTAAGL